VTAVSFQLSRSGFTQSRRGAERFEGTGAGDGGRYSLRALRLCVRQGLGSGASGRKAPPTFLIRRKKAPVLRPALLVKLKAES